MKKIKKVNILGTSYEVLWKTNAEDKIFNEISCCACTNEVTKEITMLDVYRDKEWETNSIEEKEMHSKVTLRHEITHAFLSESGLGGSSLKYNGAWSRNEEMVDWIAMQGLKLYKAWKEADCI